jgi:hypothetical protein
MPKQRGIPGEQLKFLRTLVEQLLMSGEVASARELSKEVGVDPAILHRFRKGGSLEFDTLTRMAKYFGFDDAISFLAAHHSTNPNPPISDAPGFGEAYAQARQQWATNFSDEVWRLVPGVSLGAKSTARVTPALIVKIAEVVNVEVQMRESGISHLSPKKLRPDAKSKR